MSISTSGVALGAASLAQLAADKAAAPAVNVGAGGANGVAAADGVDKKKVKDAAEVHPAQLKQSLDDINAMLNARSVSVQFQIDPAYKEAILQVVDQHDGKVLLQLPSVEAVRIAKMTEQMKGVLVAQKA
ncbi:flagellar protein FlaG [Paraherbaspirillum soli]|uniref:Flagellar protein FlaG n=1 Tax=Paraherbaspirillum soli TaxID=631222 RepID=A0ABW0MCL9_9BURK